MERSCLLRGFRSSLDAMWTEVSSLNLLKDAPALTAPSKKLVWFEESGHEPFVDEPATFNRAMVELVRPITG
jgi:pimeloyl-ACP methyl ester carboxylesterase